MSSYGMGKRETVAWAKQKFPKGATCLDVGACDGVWRKLMGDHFTMDAVEVFEPNAQKLQGYRTVFNMNVCDLKYEWYDLIIFGDVIEHMTIEEAQDVLKYAYMRCRDMIVAVPFKYVQGEMYGNRYERHTQDDLTDELFHERYAGFQPLFKFKVYAYYHKNAGE